MVEHETRASVEKVRLNEARKEAFDCGKEAFAGLHAEVAQNSPLMAPIAAVAVFEAKACVERLGRGEEAPELLKEFFRGAFYATQRGSLCFCGMVQGLGRAGMDLETLGELVASVYSKKPRADDRPWETRPEEGVAAAIDAHRALKALGKLPADAAEEKRSSREAADIYGGAENVFQGADRGTNINYQLLDRLKTAALAEGAGMETKQKAERLIERFLSGREGKTPMIGPLLQLVKGVLQVVGPRKKQEVKEALLQAIGGKSAAQVARALEHVARSEPDLSGCLGGLDVPAVLPEGFKSARAREGARRGNTPPMPPAAKSLSR